VGNVCSDYHKKIFALEAAKWDLERACKIQLLEVNKQGFWQRKMANMRQYGDEGCNERTCRDKLLV